MTRKTTERRPTLQLVTLPRGRRKKVRPAAEVMAPPMPTWLSAEAKREWNRVVPQLVNLGVVTKIDRAVLAGYCQAVAEYRAATKIINVEGMFIEQTIFARDTGREAGKRTVPHPAVALQKSSYNIMRRYANELGLSPAARKKVKVDQAAKQSNPIAELMERSKRIRAKSSFGEPGPYANSTDAEQSND